MLVRSRSSRANSPTGQAMQGSSAQPSAGAAVRAGSPAKRRKPLPMVIKLAYRNLFHDRLSLAVTLTGIVFSVVLVAVQFGIYLGSENGASRPCSTMPRPTCGWCRSARKASTIPRSCPAASGTPHSRLRVWQRAGAGRRLRQLAQAQGRVDGGAAGWVRDSAAARCPGTWSRVCRRALVAQWRRHRRHLFHGARRQQARRQGRGEQPRSHGRRP